VLIVLAGNVGAQQQTPESALREGLSALAQGLDEQAAKLLEKLVADFPDSACSPRAMCGAGQALARLGRHREALECFESAIARKDSGLRPLTLELAASASAAGAGEYLRAISHCQKALLDPEAELAHGTLYPLLIRCLQASHQLPQAWECLQEAAGLENIQKEELAELALSIGLAAATANEHAVATAALRWYLRHSTHVQDSPRVREGMAWAEALTADSAVRAAECLEELVVDHPATPSAPHALVAAAAYRIKSNDPQRARADLQLLQQRHGDQKWSTQQWNAIAETAQAAGMSSLAGSAREELRLQGISAASPRVAAEMLIDAARRDDAALFGAALVLIARSDDPVAITRALTGLTESRLLPALMELAVALIAAPEGRYPVASRAASEYFAATGQWAILSEVARKVEDPQKLEPWARKWLAEGLYQVGQTRLAYDWARMAYRQAENSSIALPGEGIDLDLLMRIAELAVQVDSREEARNAIERVAKLSSATADSSTEIPPIVLARLQLLRAEVEIREAAFDSARKILTELNAEGEIASRAAWLIGETYFMQGKLEEAINAYRKVEGQIGGERYQPLALVQAGKCFERLGRVRDAVRCYSVAVTQSVDGHVARVAQERLKLLGDAPTSRR
jgi:tetratricopeptide (TPR) repeat protein